MYLQRIMAEEGLRAEVPAADAAGHGSVSITSEVLEALQQPPRSPWLVAPFAAALAAPEASRPTANTEAPTSAPSKLAKFFLGQEPPMHMSKASVGELLDVDPQQVEPILSLIANSLLHVEALQRSTLESTLTSSGCRLVTFVDFSRYDETLMKVRHKEFLPRSCYLLQLILQQAKGLQKVTLRHSVRHLAPRSAQQPRPRATCSLLSSALLAWCSMMLSKRPAYPPLTWHSLAATWPGTKSWSATPEHASTAPCWRQPQYPREQGSGTSRPESAPPIRQAPTLCRSGLYPKQEGQTGTHFTFLVTYICVQGS